MCGRFTQQRPTSELAEIFDAEDRYDDPRGKFNVAPTDPAAVVVQREDRRAIAGYSWGLLPGWSGDPSAAGRPFNARGETVATSPLFRDSFRRRRCIVPADGFYEWLKEGRKRQPLRIFDPSERPLALAGLWTGRQDANGEWRRTFTIVTSRPNAFMAEIHDRMPVILPPDHWARWLDPTLRDPGELLAMLEPRDDLRLTAYRVAPLVNNVRNDGPELIARYEPPPEPPSTEQLGLL